MYNKIEEYYDVIADENGNLYVKVKESDEKKFVPKSEDKPLYLLCGNKKGTLEEVEELCKKGLAVKISCREIYKHYFNWTDEELCLKFNNYDLKTKKYIEQTRKNLGFIREEHGYDEEKNMKNVFKVAGWMNSSEVEIGMTSNGEWCAQYSVRTDIDDYDITRYYFSNKPTEKAIQIVELLSSLEFKFKFNRLNYEFNCWECGCKTHWLDINGDLFEKYNALEEKYCGC